MLVVSHKAGIRTSQVRRPAEDEDLATMPDSTKIEAATHIAKVPVQDLDVSVDDLKHHQLIVALANPANEEERCISSVHDLRICTGIPDSISPLVCAPLHT